MVCIAGDLTDVIEILTKGLMQGGKASPALFRFFIEDLAGDLRATVGGTRELNCPSLVDYVKLVADDLLLVGRSPGELQVLLDVCSKWDTRNGLEWKPAKCTIVVERPESLRQPTLGGTKFKI